MWPFPFLQRDSIREEIMENSDIGEHEDADVKSERQKVFNFVVSPTVGQEPPLVLLQVSQVEQIKLLLQYKQIIKSAVYNEADS